MENNIQVKKFSAKQQKLLKLMKLIDDKLIKAIIECQEANTNIKIIYTSIWDTVLIKCFLYAFFRFMLHFA